MDDEAKANLVRDVYARFGRGEIKDLLALMSDDITWELPDIALVPHAGRRVGHDGVREFFRLLGKNQEPQVFDIGSVDVSGETVTVRGRYEWHVVPTGKLFASDWTHEFEIRDGLIVGFRETTDVAAAKAAYASDDDA